jgi:hypothetical protein
MGAGLHLRAADRREYSDREDHQPYSISRNHTDKMNALCCLPMRMQIARGVGDLILRGEGILKEHLTLPKALWTKHKHHDLYLTAAEAVRYGLAEEIANFAPPFGAKIFSIG